jgi:peptide/nickel transport system substrate-binding protein
MLGLALAGVLAGQPSSELRFCLRADPKTFDPLLVEDASSETIRYLTGGVLVRVNRMTQQSTPELATSWTVDTQGRRIRFSLRPNVKFSDGTPFSAEDVAFTMRRLMDPETHSATADAFRSSNVPPQIAVSSPLTVSILFGAPVAGLERLFDQVAITSAKSPRKTAAVLGPYFVAEYKAGSEILLAKNPNYWKMDAHGVRLPYIDRVRLEIQQNRDIELVKFRRGEIDLIDSVDPSAFDELSRLAPRSAVDAGASLESEMMWFNQADASPLPAYKQAWFRSTAFRRAVSEAINRADICRIVYRGHARPAEGPLSPANRFWFNSSLKPHPYDVASARRRLEAGGFRQRGNALYDREGHPVEFSIITNAGNRDRERIASMLQQDLQAIGIRLNVVTLDFPSIIERIAQTFNYEACLLGLTNFDLDPSAQMNVWLSSAANHQWNPNQKQPATAWEAEIDRLMRIQAGETRPEVRKRAFDQVQQIVSDEAPFLYLVTKDTLTAVSPGIQGASPVVLTPQTFWNVESLRKSALTAGRQ